MMQLQKTNKGCHLTLIASAAKINGVMEIKQGGNLAPCEK